MKKAGTGKGKIVAAMKELKRGRTVTAVSRELGVSRATLYTWKAKYGRQDSSNSWRYQQLEAENQQLKQLIGDLWLEIERPVKTVRKRTADH